MLQPSCHPRPSSAMAGDPFGGVWKHSWPSASVLSSYLTEHPELVKERVVLEVGAGVACLVSLTALKLGARRVFCTDRPEALALIRKNVEANCKAELERAHVAVFFDSSVFSPLISTIRAIFDHSPRCTFLFAYQLRDSDCSVECLLHEHHLKAELLRTVHLSETIQIGRIMVEGGATFSKFLLLDGEGVERHSLQAEGLNCMLAGVESSVQRIAEGVHLLAKEASIELPVFALGLGLAGAEDPDFNERLVSRLRDASLAQHVYLNADSAASIAANFPLETGGMVLIAGTGSSARLLLKDGRVCGAGGWGHLIDDAGSAWFIAQRSIKRIFNHHDGLPKAAEWDLLDVLYGKEFSKARVASFCEPLAKLAFDGDLFARAVFHAAGRALGERVAVLSKNINESISEVPVLAVGSVFESHELLRPGLEEALRTAAFTRRFAFYRPATSPAVGAAVLAARLGHLDLRVERNPQKLFEINP
ncbi:GlcNAc kinase [Aphelenchoides fujianensis]|nr:GlcNAc kinase [Aphelenchoides fujianensis]